jgi:hypothetical protein
LVVAVRACGLDAERLEPADQILLRAALAGAAGVAALVLVVGKDFDHLPPRPAIEMFGSVGDARYGKQTK